MPGSREHPGVFELLGAPDLRKAISLGPCRIAVAPNRGMNVEQRAVGVEHEGADGHEASWQKCEWSQMARLMSAISVFHGRRRPKSRKGCLKQTQERAD